MAIVEVRPGPISKRLACIVNLSVVFVRRADGSVSGYAPILLVGGDDIAGSVSIFDDEVGTQSGIAEGWYLVKLLLLLHGVVATVGDGDGKAVGGV